MAESRRIKTRLINKHAQAAVWENTNFTPLEAELVVYDKDATHAQSRVKIGDGSTPVNELPFLTAEPASHTHEFIGTKEDITIPYTPKGTVTATYTATGEISAPEITVTPSTETRTFVTSTGTLASYKQGSCTFPTLQGELNSKTLTLSVEGGSYTPGVYTQGTLPGTSSITYVKDVSATSSKPTFTGETKTITSTFEGEPENLSFSVTPEGKIQEN